MKLATRLMQLFLIASLLISISSCKKNNSDNPDNTNIPGEPLRTPIGQLIGIAKKVTIGTNGGTISMPDNYISIQVPAGAVDGNTEFSIQEVQTNTAISTGRLFRILPEGITLKKPVEITFRYTDVDTDGNKEDYLYPCFQDQQGVWHKVMDCTLDKAAKTLKVNTTHFSDWGWLRELEIHSPKYEIGANEEIDLEAFLLDRDVESGIVLPSKLKPEQIVEWKVVTGGGTISGGKNPVVKYKAPDTQTKIEVMVEVTVKNIIKQSDPRRPGTGGIEIVRKTITILPEEYVVWTIGGKKNTAAFYNFGVFEGKAIMVGTSSQESISFKTNSFVLGKFSIGDMNKPKMSELTATYDNKTFESRYTECDTYKNVFATGSVIFDIVPDSPGGIVQGSFDGILYKLDSCKVDYMSVRGMFRLRRWN